MHPEKFEMKGIFLHKSKIYKPCKTRNFLLLVLAVCFTIFNFLYFIHFRNTSEEIFGWEKNKSRNAKDYVFPDKITTLTTIKKSCSSFMLMIVSSENGHMKLRQSVRETWAVKAQQNHITVIFLMGKSANKDLNLQAQEENLKYGDIIVEDFIDSYNNLTLKSIMMLKWVNQNCLDSRFIMKVDDDVYVNVDNLLKAIKSVKDDELPKFLLGKLYTKEKPYRSLSEKWYMPKYMFGDDSYPHYLCGVGYIMSVEVAKILYQESLKQPIVYLEDLFITGICAKKANIDPSDHLGFHFFEHAVTVECNSIHAHLTLLSHHLSASQMRDQHEQILQC